MNYYNDFDKKACALLRELIKAGLIPDGVVDERSITDVTADDLRGFTQCHFFAGIGGWSRAMQIAGWGEDKPVWTGSCPCQPFSTAGKQAGKSDEDTSGQLLQNLSPSADLQLSLANRLKARLSTGGSMIYRQTWKEKITPSGLRYWAHTASAHRISDKGFTGWLTPRSRDWKDSPGMATEYTHKDGSTRSRLDTLPRVAHLAGWPTPTETDCSRGNGTIRPQDTGIPLPQRVAMIDRDQPARLTASGQLLTGSTAGMESGGQLNPAHSRWLMGYPAEWDYCGDMAMQSCRKLQRSS